MAGVDFEFFNMPLYGKQFLIVMAYLIVSSLISSGFCQFLLIRYLTDRAFAQVLEKVANFVFYIVLFQIILSALLGIILIRWLLSDLSWFEQSLLCATFVCLNLIWVFTYARVGLKQDKTTAIAFLVSYMLTGLLAMVLYRYQFTGLLIAYYLGQMILLGILCIDFVRKFPPQSLFIWNFGQDLQKNTAFMLAGVLFQLGFWIDKFIFWFYPQTGIPVLGGLQASPIYDLPMLMALLLMIPGLMVFFYEIEANFSRYFLSYYAAIREGAALDQIYAKQREQVTMAREIILTVVKIEALFCGISLFLAPELLHFLGISPEHIYLFRIDLISAFLMVLCIGLMNLLAYLNHHKGVIYVAATLLLSNALLTYMTVQGWPFLYGYGYLLASLSAVILAIIRLNHAFEKQTYRAFMSQ